MKTKALIVSILILISCTEKNHIKKTPKITQQKNIELFKNTMQNHLMAVTNKNLKNLKATMSPKGNMLLILPGTEIISTVDSFMDYHKKWFKTTGWTFETKILSTKVGAKIGMAITEIIYKESSRNGKPYFNRMIVSYDLEKINGKWYIIKDQASSVEKSTDKKNN